MWALNENKIFSVSVNNFASQKMSDKNQGQITFSFEISMGEWAEILVLFSGNQR